MVAVIFLYKVLKIKNICTNIYIQIYSNMRSVNIPLACISSIFQQHNLILAKLKADSLSVISLWKKRRSLSLLPPSLLKICFSGALCSLSLADSPSACPPPSAAPVGWSPTSCPPATRGKVQVRTQHSACTPNHLNKWVCQKTFYIPEQTHLPGLQLLRQRHLVFDGVEKLLS